MNIDKRSFIVAHLTEKGLNARIVGPWVVVKGSIPAHVLMDLGTRGLKSICAMSNHDLRLEGFNAVEQRDVDKTSLIT